jgi:uncharacterized protein (TIGR02284 family)
METRTHDIKSDIDKLNTFLRDELSSVETYQKCLEKIDQPYLASGLTELQRSHEKRAHLLRQRVQELGGTPETSSGVWGSFSKLMESGAKAFGDKAALSVLEQGEDRGRDSYQKKSDELSPENKLFIKNAILPEQQMSHDTLNRLRATLH